MKINTDKHRITRRELKEWVRYDPLTGDMRRIRKVVSKTGRFMTIDKLITGTNNRGYRWVNLFGHMYLVHRLAFLYMTGKHPRGEVDHINGVRLDNRWVNLRDCDSAAQSRNQGVRSDSTSGVRGVTYSKHAHKWVARISQGGVRMSLGYFKSFDEAVAVRRAAEPRLGYHANHGARPAWHE